MIKARIRFHGNVRPGTKLYTLRWTKTNKLSGFGIRALRHRLQIVWW